MNEIILQDVSKSFKRFPVFKNLNLSIEKGKATALIGPNGCGKTTLLKSLLGFLSLNSGNISIFNRPVINNGIPNKNALDQVRKKIGFLSDNFLFYEHLSPYEFLSLIRLISENQTDKEEDIIKQILKDFRLDRWSNRLIHTLSTGSRQKLAIASVLSLQPQLLIMDEPLRGIDPEIKIKVLKYLKEYVTVGIPKFGINSVGTILMSSHNLIDVEKICDNIIIMNDYGEILFSGTIEEVKHKLLHNSDFEELLYLMLKEDEEIDFEADEEELFE